MDILDFNVLVKSSLMVLNMNSLVAGLGALLSCFNYLTQSSLLSKGKEKKGAWLYRCHLFASPTLAALHSIQEAQESWRLEMREIYSRSVERYGESAICVCISHFPSFPHFFPYLIYFLSLLMSDTTSTTVSRGLFRLTHFKLIQFLKPSLT